MWKGLLGFSVKEFSKVKGSGGGRGGGGRGGQKLGWKDILLGDGELGKNVLFEISPALVLGVKCLGVHGAPPAVVGCDFALLFF